jgi:hypothetical protein
MDLQSQLQHQEDSIQAQAKAEADAKTAVEQQKVAEEGVRKAEEEQRVAVDEFKKQEDSYQNACKALEARSTDPAVSLVQRNKAGAELAQMKQEDPMPLRKAKISQEACLRRVEKERKATEVRMILAKTLTLRLLLTELKTLPTLRNLDERRWKNKRKKSLKLLVKLS